MSAGVLDACKGSSPVREREIEREREREREKKGERDVFIFKRNVGCLGTF